MMYQRKTSFFDTSRTYKSLIVHETDNILTALSIIGITQLKAQKDPHLKGTIDRTLIEFIPDFTTALLNNKNIFDHEATFFKQFSNVRASNDPSKLIIEWIALLNRNQHDRNSFAETCILYSSLAATVKRIIQDTIEEAQHVVDNSFKEENVVRLLLNLAQKNADVYLDENKSIHFYRQSYLEQLSAKLSTLVDLPALAHDMVTKYDIKDISRYCHYTLTDAMFMQTARGAMNLAYDSTLLSAGAQQLNPVAKKWGQTITQIYANPFNFNGLDPNNDPLRYAELLTDLVNNIRQQDRYVEAALLARCDAQIRVLSDFTDMIDMLHAPHETAALKILREFMLKLLDTAKHLQADSMDTPTKIDDAFLLLTKLNGLRKFGLEMLQNSRKNFTEHDLYVKINMIVGEKDTQSMQHATPTEIERQANACISVACLGFNKKHLASITK